MHQATERAGARRGGASFLVGTIVPIGRMVQTDLQTKLDPAARAMASFDAQWASDEAGQSRAVPPPSRRSCAPDSTVPALIEYGGNPEYSLVMRSSDGQMLFLANKLTEMKQKTLPGSHDGWHSRPRSGRGSEIRADLQEPDIRDERPELRRTVADNAGSAHGIVVRLQGGELVVVGDEAQPAVEALVVVCIAGMEEHLLVPDNVGEKSPVRERGPTDRVVGEAGEVEPVA